MFPDRPQALTGSMAWGECTQSQVWAVNVLLGNYYCIALAPQRGQHGGCCVP